MRQHWLGWLRVLVVWLLLVGTCLPGSPGVPSAAAWEDAGSQTYAFGMYLFRLGDYYRAVTEFKRFTLLFPNHQRYDAAQLLIGLALADDASYDEALLHFQRIPQLTATPEAHLVAAFKLGELHFQQRRYGQAVDHFEQFLRLFPQSPLAPRTTYLLGLSLALAGQHERALPILDTLSAQHDLAEQAQALQRALRTDPPIRQVSPRTAGILAGILPGAGHLYLGKPGQALTALLLNGLFITGSVMAFREGLIATGAILLYFEAGWYLGNIKSAVDGAHAANRQARQAYDEALRATYALPPLTLEQLQAPGLGLRIAF